MGLNDTPNGERIHIGFFGCTNSGKSSLVNAFTNQQISIVSDIKGTTTDSIEKAMELLPLGPVLIMDTPGFDDSSQLGEKRIEAAEKTLRKCDIAVLVTDCTREQNGTEKKLIGAFKEKGIPYIVVNNKSDLTDIKGENYVSAKTGYGIFELKEKIAKMIKTDGENSRIAGDLIKKDDFVILVTPIDSSAPKGRLILPQQQTIRDLLDTGAVSVVVKETELENTLKTLGRKPSLVITDSQVFEFVSEIVPEDIALTSFSILMARYKGFLDTAVKGAHTLDNLRNGDKILISEGCTHHRQCEDIGTVKLPRLIKKYTAKDFEFHFSGGKEFPHNLSDFSLIIHCGGCMLNQKEIQYRMNTALEKNIPFTNYGIAIAHMKGILNRSIAVFDRQKKTD